MKALILVPVAFILLREIFVSGLREFLGAKAGKLKVTYLAKWKTTAQMVAIPVLLLAGVFEWDRRHNAPWVSDWFHDWVGWIAVERRAGADLGRRAADAPDRLRLPDEGDAVPPGPQAVTLTLRYFAWLRERVGEPSETVETARRHGRRARRRAARPRGALRARLRRPRGGAGGGGPGAGRLRRAARRRARGGVLPADDRGLNGGPGAARGLRPRRRARRAPRRAHATSARWSASPGWCATRGGRRGDGARALSGHDREGARRRSRPRRGGAGRSRPA